LIYTVTLNPALDNTIILESLKSGHINRSTKSITDVGGKGINVSKVVRELDGKSCALGFLGKENSDVFIKYLNDLDIENDFVFVNGETRRNIKIVETSNNVYTDINQQGFEVSCDDVESILSKINYLAKSGDIVVLSGSLPIGVGKDIYYRIITELKSKNIKTVLDAEGEVLKISLYAKPYLIKPNINELRNIFEFNKKDINEVIRAATEIVSSGIEIVVISMGESGSLFVDKDNVLLAHPVKVDVKSTVGAGDSMVGGMVYGMDKNYNSQDIFQLASACGTAKVAKEGSKPPSKDEIKSILDRVVIERLNKQ
jgi:1-phosphofructokinase